MLPSITFAIPYYANPGFLRKAMESVLSQTDSDWKLFVCDDGDGTARQVVDELEDARISYKRNGRRLGMAGNWNRCLDLADTDLVTLLHADDELLPGYAAAMKQAALRHEHAVALFCDAEVIDRGGRRSFSLPDQIKKSLKPRGSNAMELEGRQGVEALLRGNFIICPTLCYRKELLGDRRFSEAWLFIHDLEFTTRLLLSGEMIEFVRWPIAIGGTGRMPPSDTRAI